MWFAYMDEAGNTGRNLADSNQPIHLILSLAIEESRVTDVHDHVRSVAERHFGEAGLEEAFEFHGQAIFSGSAPFKGLSPGKRIAIYDEVLSVIPRVEPKVIVRGVHKPGLAARYRKPYHPHDIALMFTIESIERWATEEDCRVLLVADEAKEIEDAALRDLHGRPATPYRPGPKRTQSRRHGSLGEISRVPDMGERSLVSEPLSEGRGRRSRDQGPGAR